MITKPETEVQRLWDSHTMEHEPFEPGWAGHLTESQMRFIRDVLQGKRPRPAGVKKTVRYAWGFWRGDGYTTEAAIRAVAMYGDSDAPAFNRSLVLAAKDQERTARDSVCEARQPSLALLP